jgi:exonuclease SbcD
MYEFLEQQPREDNMRIGVIGDVHIGASYSLGHKDHSTGRNTRLLDYQKTLEKTITAMIDAGCEIIIFTGDIFEHRHPNALYQKIFSQHLYYALSNGIKEIHIVVGNHDQQRISDATTISYLQELALPNIIVHDNLDMVTIDKGGEPEVNLLFFPYRDRKWLGVDSYGEAIEKLDSQLKYQLSCIDNSAPKLLVGHMTIEGTFFADEYAELYSENELFLPKEMFNNIDVTIMGHVHSPYVISEDPYIAYVGSMERRGAFENHDKKYAIIDTRTKDIQYGIEPCRNIYDIKIDLSDTVHGELLMDKVASKIVEFSKASNIENAIVRVMLSIAADDSKFCFPRQLEEFIRKDLKAEYCVPIKPTLFFSRQARDAQINENSSDPEAFVRYVKNTVEDTTLGESIIGIGLEIIKAGDSA